MSFEGYYQVLCTNGHADTLPVQYSWQKEADEQAAYRCDQLIDGKPCGASLDWINLVDDTNFDDAGKIPLVEQTPRMIKTCDLGHTHVWTDATFKPLLGT